LNLENISNSELRVLIEEWIKGETNRAILKRRLIDGKTHSELADEFNLSVESIKKIIYKQQAILFRHIDEVKEAERIFLNGQPVMIC
jgi:DNA-directed RNA polymerase specialized sigma24 family protein